MPSIKTNDGTDIYYRDRGSKDAPPAVFHRGWPLSADDFRRRRDQAPASVTGHA